MTDKKEMTDKANIGADFFSFKHSNVGAYLIKKAEDEEMRMLRQLLTIPPDDKENIWRAQLAAMAPRMVIEWIETTISEGKAAEFSLSQGESDQCDY